MVTGNTASERVDGDTAEYKQEVEDMFIQRFYENLEVNHCSNRGTVESQINDVVGQQQMYP